MKKAYFKDSKKMFKNNLGRFISIVIIIVLGTAFFVGMNTISPAMEQTAESYMKEKRIYDYSLISNLGYKQEDIEKLKENTNITEINGVYSYDALTSFDDKDIVVRLFSSNNSNNMNKSYLIEGREIENDGECLISTRLKDMYEYDVGDTIKIYRKDETNIEDSLNYTEFKIAGIARTPIYLSKFYGNTTLLTGDLSGYIILNENAFKLEDYSSIYIKTNIDENIKRFSDEYKDKNEEFFDEIDKVNQEIVKEKYDKLYLESSNAIKETETKIKNSEQFVKEKYTEIYNSQLNINKLILNISSELSQHYETPSIYDKTNKKKNEISDLYDKIQELQNNSSELESECEELEPKVTYLNNELESIENNIEKNLYEIYSLDDEPTKFVTLSQDNYKLYYEYNQKNSEYEEINKEFETKNAELEKIQNEIKEKKEQINSLQTELYASFEGWKDLVESMDDSYFNELYAQIKSSRESLANASKILTEQNVDDIIFQAKEKVNEKKNELNQFKMMAKTTPLYKNNGFKALKDDLKKIAIMGKIFPVMFFVIAALVTITTITRMIEEDRKNIGTLKALGYSKRTIIRRYIVYALSIGILGTVLGTTIGSFVLVGVLFDSYGSLYDLPILVTKVNIYCIAISLAISLVSTVFFAWTVTKKSLKENTAELMRPKVMAIGKNILLEKIPFLWNRFDFLFKICFRNIFRYKKRLCMTLVGIAGCTALIYSGLGLQSVVDSIVNKQFRDVRIVSMEAYLKEEVQQSEADEIADYIKQQQYIKEVIPIRQQSLTVESKGNTKDVFYIAIQDNEADKYINLQERRSKKKIELNDEGVVITEKLSIFLKVKVGEKIDIIDDNIKTTVKVIGIAENYLYNYLYFTPKMYERIYGTKMQYNEIFVNTEEIPSEDQEIKLSDSIKENDKIASIALSRNLEKEFKTSIRSLKVIVFLFLGCASLLSFTVLINLNNINIEERKRELSTIKLLGFYKNELESYVFRENIILTILGTVLGLILGMAIFGVIIQAAEVETIFLVKDINYINLVISIIITLGFTLITNFLMKNKIKNIDMIDSLKSIE